MLLKQRLSILIQLCSSDKNSFLTMTYKGSSLFSLHLHFQILVPPIQEPVNIFSIVILVPGEDRDTHENDIRSNFRIQMLGLLSEDSNSVGL